MSEQTTLHRGDGATINTSITNYYLGGSGVLATNYATVTQSKYGTPTTTYYTSTTNSYRWGDGPQVSTISYNNGQGLTTVTVNSFDENGFLTSSYIGDATNRTVSYINDTQGQILSRRAYGNAPVEQRYFMNGVQMGVTGNDGAAYNQEQGHEDYATSLLNRVAAPPATPGPFANGGTYGNGFSDFDMAFDPINATNGAGGGGSYTVRAGDSLQSIAQSVWGDASLWYKLAEMNGLTASSGLATGQILMLPSGVQNHYNNASTFRPYDPSEATGDISPTTPAAVKPPKKKNKCGVFGQILLAVIAVAVAIALPQIAAFAPSAFGGGFIGGAISGAIAGAAGSIVSQGFGVATGIQDKFSWKAVGMAAIGGGVGGGIGKFNAFGAAAKGSLTSIANAAVRGALSSAVTQGIGRASGLQSSFSWTGVAAAGIAAGVADFAGAKIGAKDFVNTSGKAIAGANSINNHLAHLGASMAGNIANAATRSLLQGTSFGDNIIAALPDTLATTIGNMISHGVSGGKDEIIITQRGSATLPPAGPYPRIATGGAMSLLAAGIGVPMSLELPGFPAMPMIGTDTMASHFFYLNERLSAALEVSPAAYNTALTETAGYLFLTYMFPGTTSGKLTNSIDITDELARFSNRIMNFSDSSTSDIDPQFREDQYNQVTKPFLSRLSQEPTLGRFFGLTHALNEATYAAYRATPGYQKTMGAQADLQREGLAWQALMTYPAALMGGMGDAAVAGSAEASVVARIASSLGLIATTDYAISSLTNPFTGNDGSVLARGINNLIPGDNHGDIGNAIVNAFNFASPAVALSRGFAGLARTGPSFLRSGATARTVFNNFPNKTTLQFNSVAEQANFLATHVDGLSAAQATDILNGAFARKSSAVFGGSRIRGDHAWSSDLDVGFGSMSASQAGRLIKRLDSQAAQTPGALRLDPTRIVPGNSTANIPPIKSPEEFFQRSGVRGGRDSFAGQRYGPSGSITVMPNGAITIIPPGARP